MSESSFNRSGIRRTSSTASKSRKRPIAEIEDGHRTNTVNRLCNIACRLSRRLRWDGETEQVTDDPEANRLAVAIDLSPRIPKGLRREAPVVATRQKLNFSASCNCRGVLAMLLITPAEP